MPAILDLNRPYGECCLWSFSILPLAGGSQVINGKPASRMPPYTTAANMGKSDETAGFRVNSSVILHQKQATSGFRRLASKANFIIEMRFGTKFIFYATKSLQVELDFKKI